MKRYRSYMLYVYILKCADKSYYVGVTNNPDKRLIEHNIGVNPEAYTYSRRPVERVYVTAGYTNFRLAIAREKQLKKWTRKKKEALIDGRLGDLKKFAECKNETSHKYFYNPERQAKSS